MNRHGTFALKRAGLRGVAMNRHGTFALSLFIWASCVAGLLYLHAVGGQ